MSAIRYCDLRNRGGRVIPQLGLSGDLPTGIHIATLDEVRAHFGTSTIRRQALFTRLLWIHSLAAATGKLRRFVLFGSFVTDKPEPNDIDVFLMMENDFEFPATTGDTRILFDHQAAETHFGASVFWMRPTGAIGGEDAAVADWQIKRGGGQRGIVEVIESQCP